MDKKLGNFGFNQNINSFCINITVVEYDKLILLKTLINNKHNARKFSIIVEIYK